MTTNQDDKLTSLSNFFVFLQNTGRLNDAVMTQKAIKSLRKHLDDRDPEIADLTEQVIKSWIDELLPRLSVATITRYVESLAQIYKYAIRLGYIADSNTFDNIREYIDGLCDEGFGKLSQRQIESIRKLANTKFTEPSSMGLAIDVYLYSFYHAAMDIDTVIELKDDSQLCQLSQTEAIKAKYNAPHRRYIFPLSQWQKTTKQNRIRIENNFRNCLQINDINIGDKSYSEFIANAWVAAAKSCGVSNADICACCPQVMANPKLKDVVPSMLSQPQIDAIKQQVANVIIDMAPHWYAIRFIGKDDIVRDAIKEICGTTPYTIYYPIEEIYKRRNRKRVIETRPTIRNVMFVNTTSEAIARIATTKLETRTFHVLRNTARKSREFAIIPDREMRTFSMLVSNGLDILGEEELQEVEILEGSYVEITAGFNKGYRGRVLKVRNRDSSKATLLQIQADLCPNLSAVMNKLYITVSPEFVKLLEAVPQ
jgi:transcription antitermination factor NusG